MLRNAWGKIPGKQSLLFKFIYFERKRACAGEGQRARARGRDRILSRLCTIRAEPQAGLEHLTCETTKLEEIKRPVQLSCPGAPGGRVFLNNLF